MYCAKCGKKLEENQKFCSGCGQPVKEVKQADINANIRMYRNDHLKMYKITL